MKKHTFKPSDADRNCADALRRASARRCSRAAHTFGIYATRSADSIFGFPFCAASDDLALRSIKEICPLLNLYLVGRFHTDDGTLERIAKPILILDNHV